MTFFLLAPTTLTDTQHSRKSFFFRSWLTITDYRSAFSDALCDHSSTSIASLRAGLVCKPSVLQIGILLCLACSECLNSYWQAHHKHKKIILHWFQKNCKSHFWEIKLKLDSKQWQLWNRSGRKCSLSVLDALKALEITIWLIAHWKLSIAFNESNKIVLEIQSLNTEIKWTKLSV